MSHLEKMKEFYRQREQLALIAKEVVLEVLLPVFEKFSEASEVVVKSYTPYFNDGDSCRYSANLDYAEVYDGLGNEMDYSISEVFREALSDNIGEDNWEIMFGNDVEITITKDNVDVDYYGDHN